MQKPMYFDVDNFVNQVLQAMKLGDVPAPVLLDLRETIENRLSDRIMGTVIESFGEQEMMLFEKLLTDHAELDEVDVVMMIAPQINGLKEKLLRNINSLYEELTYDADRIEESMKAGQAASAVSAA